VSFSVSGTGAAPLTYQWLKNGQPIAGATSAALALPSAQAADVGSYVAVVSNNLGDARSNAAVLSVTPNEARFARGTYHGLVLAAIPTLASSGAVKVTIAANGAFTGRIVLGGTAYAFAGAFDQAGVARFGSAKATSLVIHRPAARSALVLALQWNASLGSGTITGTITDPGVFVAAIRAEPALFTAAKNPVAPQLNVPGDLLGAYNLLFPPGQSTSLLVPRGFGWGRLTVGSSGSVRLTGLLADGTPIAVATNLLSDGRWPLYFASDAGRTAVSAMVSVAGDGESDVTGTVLWFKDAVPARAVYPAGWPGGITSELRGSRYLASKTLAGALAGGAATAAPARDAVSAIMTFCGGELPNDLVAHASIAGDSLQVISTELKGLKLGMAKTTGVLTGSFLHPSGGKLTRFKGVYLQRQGLAAGFFMGSAQSGEVLLTRD
jgi:hypothetical protein